MASWTSSTSLETDPQVSSATTNKVPKWNGTTLVDGTIVDNGNIGIGTTSTGAKLEVAGQVKITGGTPGAGKVLTSDGSGLATWKSRTPLYTSTTGTTTYGVSSSWQDVTSPITLSNWNIGDLFKIEANLSLRLTGGTGIDDFNIRVKFSYSSCGDEYSDTFSYTPAEDLSNHDDFRIVPYLAMHTLDGCSAGSLTVTLQVQNTGDDPWEARNRILVLTKY